MFPKQLSTTRLESVVIPRNSWSDLLGLGYAFIYQIAYVMFRHYYTIATKRSLLSNSMAFGITWCGRVLRNIHLNRENLVGSPTAGRLQIQNPSLASKLYWGRLGNEFSPSIPLPNSILK